MRPRSAMYPAQRLAAERAAERRRQALLLDVGDGKTAAALTALLDAEAWPALVVAPAGVVAVGGWEAEARRWDHLKSLAVVPLVGPPARRLATLGREDAHVNVVSYENLLWLTEEVPLATRYRALVYDELSCMKHPGTRRFRRMRARAKAGSFEMVLGLTGSPVGNHVLDLWGEMFAVAGADALGPRFGDYRSRYFAPVDYYQRVWHLKCCPACAVDGGCSASPPWVGCRCHREALADISGRCAPWSFVAPPGTAPPKPPVRLNVVRCPMPAETARLAGELTRELWARLPSGAELEALSASAAAVKLRQLASGAVYTLPAEVGEEPFLCQWEEVHAAKLDALDVLLDELQGEPLLVYYWFRHDAARIKRRLFGRAWADFADSGAEAVEAWNRGELEVLLMHPQSGGRGLNLQDGGHHACWFTLPWSRELFDQGPGRLARPGQRADHVTAHLLLCGPTDERVASVLASKGEVERIVKEELR